MPASRPQRRRKEKAVADDYEHPVCKNCGERIELIRFALGPEWRHWPTRWGNYNTSEKYRFCRQQVAEPREGKKE